MDDRGPPPDIRWKETHRGGDLQNWAQINGVDTAWALDWAPTGKIWLVDQATEGSNDFQSIYSNCVEKRLETGGKNPIGPLCVAGGTIGVATGDPIAVLVGGASCLGGIAIKLSCTLRALHLTAPSVKTVEPPIPD